MNNSKPENNILDLERTEDKYIVPKNELIKVKSITEQHLPLYFPESDTVFTINTSIYFDSPDLTFLRQHLEGLDDRRKIRIRCYAPNGIPNHIYFIEVKAKNDGDSIKTRLQISNQGYDYVMANNKINLDEELFLINEDMPQDEVSRVAKYINYLMITNNVSPVVEINYKRYAYQEDESFRVTLDSKLMTKPLRFIKMETIQGLQDQGLWDDLKKYGEKFSNLEDFILEVKYNDKMEDWCEEMIEELDVEATGFSKYLWGLYNLMNQSIKMVTK